VKEYPKEGYIKTQLKDGYDNLLIYHYPSQAGEPFDLISPGPDGKEGGEFAADDVWNHDKRPPKKEEPKKDEKK
jgi:hypothetical protein